MDEWKMRPIGYIRSSYTSTDQVPKGLGTIHSMEGILEVLPEFAEGLQDIEGYSHLMILWVFHQAQGCELVGRVPTDNQDPRRVFHALPAPAQSNRIDHRRTDTA